MKNTTKEYQDLEPTGKGNTLWSQYCWYLVASIAIVAVVFSGTELQALDRFGETFTSKLCEILPPPQQKYNEVNTNKKGDDENEEEEEEFNDAVVSFGEERTHNATYSKLSHVYVAGGRKYKSFEAMEDRYIHMKKVCNQYADKMRGESLLHEILPKSHKNFLYYPVKKFAFCQLPGVGSKSVHSFLFAGEMGKPGSSGGQEAFSGQFPKIMRFVKSAMVVRHPMERLISIYRNTFEAHMDANNAQATRKEQEYTFSEFIDIVVHGYSQLSRFFEQNNLDMSTNIEEMDTGMVDGEKGHSLKWNSYWRHCGVCHYDFQPQYILHLEHLREDMRVIFEKWMEPKYWTKKEVEFMERFLNLKRWDIASSNPLMIEHYYSQLKKSQIQALYEKYRADHELFGYTPDYFLALGKEE